MRVLTDWLLTPQRAALHLPTATVVIADLHLGYCEARRAAGEAVPVHDLGHVLAPLAQLVDRHGIRRLVVAGDLFETAPPVSLVGDWLAELARIGLELAGVVPGNHDRGLGAGELPLFPDGFRIGRWHVAHGDGPRPAGPLLQGHVHPCLRWGCLTAPCFLVKPDHLVLPAFSPDAAGVGVLGRPEWHVYRCCAIAGDRVLDFGTVAGLARKKHRPLAPGR